MEPVAWGSVGGTALQAHRAKAIIAPLPGSRTHPTIVNAWDNALMIAFGVQFVQVVGRLGGRPNGFGTDQLAQI
eukprot:4219593-Prymnesium_polylepis.2